jgi:hypothetical protein
MSDGQRSGNSQGVHQEKQSPGAHAQTALRLPVPVPLLMQLTRPIATMDDVESLAAQLKCARARGCF